MLPFFFKYLLSLYTYLQASNALFRKPFWSCKKNNSCKMELVFCI